MLLVFLRLPRHLELAERGSARDFSSLHYGTCAPPAQSCAQQ
jgi:hypothetical protein